MTSIVPVLGLVLLYFGPGQTPKTAIPASSPSSSPVATQGRLERQTVRYYVRLHQPAVRNCYVQELARRRGLRVDVAVDFTVGPSGAVSGCSAGESAIGHCVAKAVCAIRFPAVFDELEDGSFAPSRRSTQVRYRFRFQPAPTPGELAQASQPSDPLARDRAADDAEDAAPPAAQPVPARPARPGSAVPAPAVRPAAKPAKRARDRGLLHRPRSDDPLDGIDGGGDPL